MDRLVAFGASRLGPILPPIINSHRSTDNAKSQMELYIYGLRSFK